VENKVIEELLKIVEDAVIRLRKKQGLLLEEYLTNWEEQDIVEREFQRAIQGCIDIGARIIAKERLRKPDDYHGIFDILLEEKLLGEDLAKRMKEMIGFGNAMIHEYRYIRHEEVFRHLKESLDIFGDFARCIEKWL